MANFSNLVNFPKTMLNFRDSPTSPIQWLQNIFFTQVKEGHDIEKTSYSCVFVLQIIDPSITINICCTVSSRFCDIAGGVTI